ncbi:hypothetical protein HDU76_002094, partial [Blyttiomyces sp. JEL0837]
PIFKGGLYSKKEQVVAQGEQVDSGGAMIPISVEYEEELWSKRSDPGVLEEHI